jgi:hypothetical protein
MCAELSSATGLDVLYGGRLASLEEHVSCSRVLNLKVEGLWHHR